MIDPRVGIAAFEYLKKKRISPHKIKPGVYKAFLRKLSREIPDSLLLKIKVNPDDLHCLVPRKKQIEK